jgi:DMSO reductase anchor subunit
MHPAYSVIFFTTASGAGYGLLIWLGLFSWLGWLPSTRGFGFAAMALSLGLIGGGLLSSTAHLGRPERFLMAFREWRTSWLSREGVLAIATFIPAGLFSVGWVFLGSTDGVFGWAGLAAAALALATIYTTAMIYRSLGPIQQWSNGLTVPVYVTLGLATGAVLLVALTLLLDAFDHIFAWIATLFLAIGWGAKSAYWQHIDTAPARSTLATATGLGKGGSVRLFEAPHTEENYVMREMGYRIARAHSEKLRFYARMLLFAAPILMIMLALAGSWWLSAVAVVLAVASAGVGVVVERWLFFAEAKHVSVLYYER